MNDRLEKFQWLIHPISKKEFFNDFYEKKHLFISNRDKEYYNKILTTKDIDEALTMNRIPPNKVRMSKLGALSHDNWTSLEQQKKIHLDLKKIAQALDDGKSLVLNNLDEYVFKLHQFIEAFSHELFLYAWTNIYITPPSFQAFNPHFDTHDVFILQIEGEKRWKLYDIPIELPDKKDSYLNKQLKDYHKEIPAKELLLKEGDFLYIPRGMVHEASATDNNMSIHITLGVTPTRVLDLADTIQAEILNDVFFRKSILVNQQTVDENTFEQFKEKLQAIVNRITLEQVQEFTQSKFAKKHFTTTSNNEILNQFIAKRNISLETKLCKQPLANYQLSMNGHLLIVKMGNKQEEYPFFLRPIIEAILKNNENGIALKDIPHNFGETEMVKLVKRLVSEGIFKIVE
jgi:ribosomal protein L16 Arg81 hydroxylase